MELGQAVLAATVLLCIGCTSHSKLEQVHAREGEQKMGDAVSIERIDAYAHLTLRAMFWWEGLAKIFPTENGITLYRVRYWTVAPDERLVVASGLVGVPKQGAPFRGVVSWQHGTASLRSAAPSSLDVFNGLFPAAIFAGHGYLLVAPDYLGFGESDEPHSYYHTKSMARAVVDSLGAVKSILGENGVPWPEELFLTGFSQGGHAALAAQRLIEKESSYGLEVTASAPVAAAVDLAGIGIRSALEGRSQFGSLYIAWIALSYSRDYGKPLESVLKEPWVSRVPDLMDGHHDGASVVAGLPTYPRDLLNPTVLDAIENEKDHWFLEKLRENDLLGWTPQAPVRMYFGEADVDVTPDHAYLMRTMAQQTGADLTIVSVGPLEHDPSVVAAVPLLRDWFDSLSAAPEAQP